MKNVKKTLVILMLILVSFTVQANQFYTAKIILSDNSIKEGLATLPSNQGLNNSIKFKNSEKGKELKIKNDEINSMIITLENGSHYLFERIAAIFITNSYYDNREKQCSKSKKSWVLANFISDKIYAYSLAQSYVVNKEGVMVSKTVDRTGAWAEVFLLVKRSGEPCATVLGSLTYGAAIIGKEKKFKKGASLYFKDDQNLVNRIESNEFKSDEVVKLAKSYAGIQ